METFLDFKSSGTEAGYKYLLLTKARAGRVKGAGRGRAECEAETGGPNQKGDTGALRCCGADSLDRL